MLLRLPRNQGLEAAHGNIAQSGRLAADVLLSKKRPMQIEANGDYARSCDPVWVSLLVFGVLSLHPYCSSQHPVALQDSSEILEWAFSTAVGKLLDELDLKHCIPGIPFSPISAQLQCMQDVLCTSEKLPQHGKQMTSLSCQSFFCVEGRRALDACSSTEASFGIRVPRLPRSQ